MGSDRLSDLETLFKQSVKEVFEQAKALNDIDMVIGIPFYNEKDVLPSVVKDLEEGLIDLQCIEKSLIVCVGDHRGTEVLQAVKRLDLKVPHLEFLMLPGVSGRGACIRAILEMANLLEADAVIFAADLLRENDRGRQPDWIKRVIEPIRSDYDFVLATLQKHYFEDLLGSLFMAPLLEVFYGYSVKGSLSGIYAMSHDVVESLCSDLKFWVDVTYGLGIDPWLVTRSMRWNKKLCLVELGAKLEGISLDRLNLIFKETARSMFECIKRDEDYWQKAKFVLKTPDICGGNYSDTPYAPDYSTRDLALFRYSYYQYKNLYDSAYYDYLYDGIEDVEKAPAKVFEDNGKIWANIVFNLLFKYWFSRDVPKDDILNGLTFAFGGKVASYIEDIQSLQEELEEIKGNNIKTEDLIHGKVTSVNEKLRKDFLMLRDNFVRVWSYKGLEMKPPIIPAHYLEFIPGAPIVLHKKIMGRGDRVLWTEEMFNRLGTRYHEAFSRFIYDDLQVPEDAEPKTIIRHVEEFMMALDKVMDRVFPGNLYTEEGVKQVVEGFFLKNPVTFSIKDEVFQEMLIRFPPLNVMIPAGCKTVRELIRKMDVRDAVSLANLVETRKYGDRSALLWMLDNLRPDAMGEVEIKPIVLGKKVLSGTVKLASISDLNKLSSRIVCRPFNKGMGGGYPKLRFCLFILRHIVIAENYAYLWRTYARERKNLGGKIRNSLIGRYETEAFTAHNIFENFHHRALVHQLRVLSEELADKGHTKEARLIGLMCDGYGLSQVLADGTFLPCSAWSWASYSYKGGIGVPTPLSSHVEEKWFNHEFLEEIYTELGNDPCEILRMVAQLIGEGRASENLLDILMGIRPKDITVVEQETLDYPPAGQLVRYSGNPILSPIKEHSWESKYVLNTAALRIKDRVYLLYRAYGDDEVSTIGLAVTDGYRVLERLPMPIFIPINERDKKGVEDPRVAVIDNKIYMLYTAYDGVIAQISAASITIEDFLNRKFDKWERKGLAFQDVWDKDAILFPEKINGKYVIYHRIEPSIWVSHLDKLEFPAPKESHIILGPRSGRMWDSLKIGAGTQPIKTRYGWLLIYHGVDRERVYRLGVILTDLNNPERLLYRSPNPILSPETEYEIGKEGESWVPNVVFTCGTVPAEDKEELDVQDEILVYYGAADTHVCLATAKVGDLIPESVRQETLS